MMAERGSTRLDFFVSYAQADQTWAEWIAWQLEAAGYSTVLQAWDFVAGSDWGISDATGDGGDPSNNCGAVVRVPRVRVQRGRLEGVRPPGLRQGAVMADEGGLTG
jgi:hypothetical protein